VFRRKRLPAELLPAFEAFRLTLEPLERGKEALVSAVPSARLPGRPLPDALLEFEDGLRETEELMDGWRHEDLEEEWELCRHGLAEALRMADALRTDPPQLPFDAMAFAIQDLIASLEPFASAAERFRSLRR
jgi:hypothetical protein